MGYNIYQSGSNFTIDADNLLPLAKHLAQKYSPPIYPELYKDASPRELNFYLEEFFNEFAFEIEVEKEGITSIHYTGEKSWKEDEFCDAIAPYVKKGSYIEFTGEDSAMWRHVFTGKKAVISQPTIIWDDPLTLE